jgi:hypothetical protein
MMELFEVEFAKCPTFAWPQSTSEATPLVYEEDVQSIAQALAQLEECLAQEPDPYGSAYDQIGMRIHHHDVAMQLLLDVGITEAFSKATAKRCAELDVRAYMSIENQATRDHAAQIMKPMLVSRQYRHALYEASPQVLAAAVLVRPGF